MADIGALRNALQTRLDTVPDLKPYDVATGGERMPCAIVFPAPTGPGWQTAGDTAGHEQLMFHIEVYVALGRAVRTAQDELDAYISSTGTKSIERAIYGDRTLGGNADYVRVLPFGRYQFAWLNAPTTSPPNALMARIPVLVGI